ncbi:MAG TPA: HAMP domain-containing sensor histidine kinase [Solirubrobacteraceae bacterium]|nr:HAMP domain-containing sensor histidine kinase [Solirubrobacteraceae bacterium]
MIALAGWLIALAAGLWMLKLRCGLARRMELVARACHELRGPLTGARLGMDLLAREAGVRPDAVSAVELELARASTALEDLSAALAGQSGPTRVGTVDVPALLRDALEAFRPLASDRGVDLGLRWQGEPTVVHADRVRLAQATGNLIANAIEHGAGRVEVRGGASGAGVEIEVADGGHGLPAPVADLVKRPRGGRGRRGRGLAIAADVAHRHGGRLETSSDGGSRVVLSLPHPRS